MRKVSNELRRGLLMLVLGAAALSACGSSGGGTPTGAGGTGGGGTVAGTKRLDMLSSAEIKQLCDMQAMIQGGYGHITDCGGGATMAALPSQQNCVDGWYTNCAATVADAEACWHALSCTTPEPLACAPLLPTVCN
jgi:hypothetical protein